MPSATDHTPGAAVIGGGLVGLACALQLQAMGLATTLIDPASTRRRASWGNAGHIATEQVEPLASAKTVRSLPHRLFSRGGALALPMRDVSAWMPFSLRLLNAASQTRFNAGTAALTAVLAQALPAWRRLAAAVGAESLIVEDGHFVTWETPEGAKAGRAAWAQAPKGTASFTDANAADLAELAGLMSRPPAGAIRFQGTGRVLDITDLNDRLAAGFARNGGQLICDRVDRLMLEGSRTAMRLQSGAMLRADIVVVAAGVDSGRLLTPLGHRAPIIAERGYHIQTDVSEWPVDLPPVVFEERSMIVTRFRSALRAASFVEFSREDSPPDPRKWARLRRHVAELGLPFQGAVTEWIGARPTLPDYLPAIGRSACATNLYYAFGHQHLGLTLAAVTGEALAALVDGKDAGVDLRPFDLERFS